MSTVELDYRGTSASHIRNIYDVGNEFWNLWLDERMLYSCGMWEEGDTLEQAQLRKIDYHVEQAGAVGVDTVLDVGCGWGATLRRLVEHHGVRHVVGLTLSEEQAAWIRAWDDPRIEVRVENWFDHTADAPYDAMISVGAFEHFAQEKSTREEKIAAYRDFFKFARDHLREGGRLSLQTSAKANTQLTAASIEDARFIWEYIFPETEVPWISEIDEAARRRFEMIRLRNDAQDYALTAAAWLERLRDRRDEAVEMVGEEGVQIYERYLGAFVSQFSGRHLGLLRMTFARV